jgi:intraflagellar transport protein 172
MYTDLNHFSEALRVAKKHAPQLVNDINNKAMNQKSGRAISGEDLLNSAKIWEDSRDYRKAIDTYLEIKVEHFPSNVRNLEFAWERAVIP